MCFTVDNCCCCISLEVGTKIISIIYTILSICTLVVFAPLAILGDLPQVRFLFYTTLAVLAIVEIVIGSVFIHGAFKRKPNLTWPWLILAWCKGCALILLTAVGMVMLAATRDVDTLAEVTSVISVYFIYSALLLYFTSVVNSRRQELILQNYWATKHVLRHAKTQYYYV